MTTTSNVVPWMGSWDRKRTLGKDKGSLNKVWMDFD